MPPVKPARRSASAPRTPASDEPTTTTRWAPVIKHVLSSSPAPVQRPHIIYSASRTGTRGVRVACGAGGAGGGRSRGSLRPGVLGGGPGGGHGGPPGAVGGGPGVVVPVVVRGVATLV